MTSPPSSGLMNRRYTFRMTGTLANFFSGIVCPQAMASPTGFGAAGDVRRTSPQTGRQLETANIRNRMLASPTGFKPDRMPFTRLFRAA